MSCASSFESRNCSTSKQPSLGEGTHPGNISQEQKKFSSLAAGAVPCIYPQEQELFYVTFPSTGAVPASLPTGGAFLSCFHQEQGWFQAADAVTFHVSFLRFRSCSPLQGAGAIPRKKHLF
jgi:hypothetical protein